MANLIKQLGQRTIELGQRGSRKVRSPENSKLYQKLRGLGRSSQDKLLSVNAVFPFDLFPDTITIDRTKVTVIKRNFFFVEQKSSISTEDLLNVEMGLGPFFGTIKLHSRFFVDGQLEVRFLWRDQARQVERICQAIIIARQHGIDIAKIPRDELMGELYRIGKR